MQERYEPRLVVHGRAWTGVKCLSLYLIRQTVFIGIERLVGMLMQCITSELFVASDLCGIEEGLHWGFSEAVTALVSAVVIVVSQPKVKIGLQLVD